MLVLAYALQVIWPQMPDPEDVDPEEQIDEQKEELLKLKKIILKSSNNLNKKS